MPGKRFREDYLHWALKGEHVLLQSLHLDSTLHFIAGSLLIIVLCLTERSLTVAISKKWAPFQWTRRSRFWSSAWSASLYWLATMLRLAYMLVAMSYNIGLIVVTATALAAGQFLTEYLNTAPQGSRTTSIQRSYHLDDDEPLLGTITPEESPIAPRVQPKRIHTKARSKPDGIFIHPNESNIMRAESIALEMSTRDTELVKSPAPQPTEKLLWEQEHGNKTQGILASTSRMKFPSQA